MAPPFSARSLDSLQGEQPPPPSSHQRPKDWKELIDNGLAAASGGGWTANRQNQTTSADDLTPARAVGTGSNLIPLYCGLLGALICGLVLWVVLKHARSRNRDAKLAPPSAATDVAAFAPLSAEEADADSCEGEEAFARRPLRDLSESRMRRLEQLLDRGAAWKALAAELGHQADSVAQLESRASLASASPAGLLLREWETSASDAANPEVAAVDVVTVGELRSRLLAAGLTDARACLRDPTAVERKRRHHRQPPAPQLELTAV